MNHPLIVTTNYLASDSELIVVGVNNTDTVIAAISYGGYFWNDSIRTNIIVPPEVSPTGQGVAWNGSNWCVVGYSTNNELSFISENGYTWDVTTQYRNFLLMRAQGIASDGEYWVKVGFNMQFSSTTCSISSNGRNWLAASQDPFSQGEANAIAWNGYYWCTVGYSTLHSVTVATSIDGSNWNRSTAQDPFFDLDNTENKAYGIAWNGSYWLAVGRVNGGRIAKSINGKDWDIINISFFDTITGIAWSGTNWGIVGRNSDNTITFAISSGDTTNFSPSGLNPFPGGRANGIAWTGSLWALAGRNSSSSVTVAISSNGLDWTRTSAFTNGVCLHIASKFTKYLIPTIESQIPTFISVGSNSSQTQGIARSLNGINWYFASNNPFLGGVGYGIAYNSSNLWVAVGKNADGSVTAATSSNGSFWIPSINNPFPGGVGNGIAYNGSNLWVAVGTNSTNTISISTSTNGSNWTSSTDPFNGTGYAIGWNGVYWCAVGISTSGNIIAARSSTTSTWITSVISSGGMVYGIAWNGVYWCAVGKNNSETFWTSEKTYIWTPITSGFTSTGTVYGIAWNGSIWLAVGSNSSGSIVTFSTNGSQWFHTDNKPFGILGTAYGISWNGYFWGAVGKNSDSTTFFKSIDGIFWKNATDNFTGGSSYGIASRFTDYLLPRPIAPGPPIINSINSLDKGLTVNFSAPLNTGGAEIEGYYYSMNDLDYTRIYNDEFSLTIDNLLNGVSYTVYMKARNAAEYYSSVTSISGTPYTIPNPPTTVSAVGFSNRIDVLFSPSTDNGGSAILSYRIKNSGQLLKTIQNSEMTSVKTVGITDLIRGTSYSFDIFASNAAGLSEAATTNSAKLMPYVFIPEYSPTTGDTVTYTLPTTYLGLTIARYALVFTDIIIKDTQLGFGAVNGNTDTGLPLDIGLFKFNDVPQIGLRVYDTTGVSVVYNNGTIIPILFPVGQARQYNIAPGSFKIQYTDYNRLKLSSTKHYFVGFDTNNNMYLQTPFLYTGIDGFSNDTTLGSYHTNPFLI